uniref:NAD(P)H-quinone oxidoreductase subunit 5, chloroplastic n=1 Tax=Anthoceros angustus TaxID=48387 RepID=NU5C_ANTAG|nr:NADH dehydrogenase subunit 5 [Anthoceros angustus]Q859V1.1 RecName: Full=NAD(P)H-quinone oxidoreductase subunit 5, chloroplastic; AltName: Full=NAD(P)H dehydrogenase subunit 5; AltName: Full=NADH-plastoquinone oxidoreductase subunit 5 [Anthoceros angustus]BAC55396.1 NADH dehydrogenase ND5 subunit [Anthoceros angustus]BAC55496.1 NADH dehydrogenase ND5 subunit [Anthoceros angustus]
MQLIYQCAWIVPLCPLISSILIGLGLLFFEKSTKSIRRICAISCILSLSVATVICYNLSYEQIIDNSIYQYSWSWISNGDIVLEFGYLIDPLTCIMLVLVTSVAIIVMIYSDGYMSHDEGYVRFFVYLSLFTASMLGLVLSPNLIQIYIFWELVGMCSYLLIGFWFTRPSAANACQKAFITNRIGDFGLLLGILGFYWITGSFEFENLFKGFKDLLINNEVSPFFAILCASFLFLGPVAKSAQFPLHVWLPDAMEGPTPISALIHAATMVAAGIYLVARMFPLFETLPFVMSVISWTGAVTALLGATLAFFQKDLKRGLAYSTMSQLGYMMLALGIGSYRAGLFHLITHAYSKALLFLGSGSVIHSMEPIVGYRPDESQNMIFMGGLRKHMPITGTTFLLGTLSLCGIPPFACFWSKDEIIADSWLYSPFIGWIALLTAGLTSFYMFRIYFLTFEGEFRANSFKENTPVSSVSLWGEFRFEEFGEKKADSVLQIVEKSSPKEFFRFVQSNRESSETQIGNYLSAYPSKEPIHFLYPKESDYTMLIPLLILSIPTLLIGFIGAPLPNGQLGSDLLSHWLNSFGNLSPERLSENWLEFIEDAITSISIASFGIFSAFILYGPASIFPRDLEKKIEPQLKGVWGFFINYMYNWSQYRGYIDQYYNKIFVEGTRILAYASSFFDRWIIDGIVNGTGISSFSGGEGMRYGEGGRVSSYLFGLVFGMTILLAVILLII